MRFLIINLVILLSIVLSSYGTEKKLVIVKSKLPLEFQLIGYNGFESFIIKQSAIDSASTVEVPTDYRGLALMKFRTGQQYPLIISGAGNVIIDLHQPNIPPSFERSPENVFFYAWLADYMQQNQTILSTQMKRKDQSVSDSLIFALEAVEKKAIERQKELTEVLNTSELRYTKTILNAKLLIESTYSIKTLDELKERRGTFYQFIDQNYGILQYSDMLDQLAKQYFMMHEYVSYQKKVNDFKSASTEQENTSYQSLILTGVDEWLSVLKGRIFQKQVVEFCTKIFYDRSMVSQATRIIDHCKSQLNTGYKNSVKEAICMEGDQLCNFDFVNSSRLNKPNTTQLKVNKILSIVSDKSISSMTETIALARKVFDNNLYSPIVVVPAEKLSNEYLLMDDMFAGILFFMDDEAWRKKYLGKEISLPQFILLDDQNRVVKVTSSREEMISSLAFH